MNRLFFVVLGLAAVAFLAVSPVDATTATATPMPTATANESSTNGTISTVEVIDLLDSGTWTEEQARDVYGWVRTNDLDALPEEQTRELYRRLLERAAQRGGVPDDVLERATGAVEDSEAIVEDLAGQLPEDQLRDLAEDLDGAGTWAEGIATEAIHALTAGASTPEPTRTPPPITGNASTVYADLGTVEVTDWEFTDGEMAITLRATLPTDVVITDAMGITEEGVTTLNRRRITVRNRRIVRMDVTEVDDAAAVTVATRGAVVSISTGVEDRNPFRYFGGTSGLFSGVFLSMGLSVGATAFVLWREESGVIQA